MDRHSEEIRAAAKRHSPFWREIIELSEHCCMVARETGSNLALSMPFMTSRGVQLTGREATMWVLILEVALRDVPNIDATVVWLNQEDISKAFSSMIDA